MKIEFKKVEAYQVQTTSGLLTLEKVSMWNGLMELKDTQGRKLIVVPSESDGRFSQLFREAFGGVFADGFGAQVAYVVLATPELAAELGIVPTKN